MKKFFGISTFFCILTALFAVNISGQTHFIANLSGRQEVPAVTTAGKGVGVLTVNAAQTQFSVSITYSGLSSNVTMAHIHGDAPAGANAPVLFNFNFTGGTSGTINAGPFNITPAQLTSLRAKRWYFNVHTVNNSGGEIRGQIKRTGNSYYDFDGDAKDDVTVYRPSTFTDFAIRSLDNTAFIGTFGQAGDLNGQIDFDNDGLNDLSRLRPNPMTGDVSVFILRSSDNTVANLGVLGNVSPLVGDRGITFDFDGDGKTDYGTYRSTTSQWRIFESSNNFALRTFTFGQPGDAHIHGDFDGDGKTNVGVIRNIGGTLNWIIRRTDGTFFGFQWGIPNDFTSVAQGDIDGDGRDDPTVIRITPDNKYLHFVRRSSDNTAQIQQWGNAGDTGGIGYDFDGDGKYDFTARRTIGGQYIWFILQSSTGTPRVLQWGISGDE